MGFSGLLGVYFYKIHPCYRTQQSMDLPLNLFLSFYYLSVWRAMFSTFFHSSIQIPFFAFLRLGGGERVSLQSMSCPLSSGHTHNGMESTFEFRFIPWRKVKSGIGNWINFFRSFFLSCSLALGRESREIYSNCRTRGRYKSWLIEAHKAVLSSWSGGKEQGERKTNIMSSWQWKPLYE